MRIWPQLAEDAKRKATRMTNAVTNQRLLACMLAPSLGTVFPRTEYSLRRKATVATLVEYRGKNSVKCPLRCGHASCALACRDELCHCIAKAEIAALSAPAGRANIADFQGFPRGLQRIAVPCPSPAAVGPRAPCAWGQAQQGIPVLWRGS